jgi:SAM-dependent methyltransferase
MLIAMSSPQEPPDSIQNPLDQHGSWDAIYSDMRPDELPWNAGGPDAELVRLVESGVIPVGRAIDLGTGPGHDAVCLAKAGFKVLAVDIAPSAIELAKANAKRAGLGVAIDFRVEDVLRLSSPANSATFINDRGCFHELAAKDRETYVRHIYDVLVPGGHLFLRTFSEKEPPRPGPHRFTKGELEDLFSAKFHFIEFKDDVYDGPRTPKPKTYVCLLQKKAEVVRSGRKAG